MPVRSEGGRAVQGGCPPPHSMQPPSFLLGGSFWTAVACGHKGRQTDQGLERGPCGCAEGLGFITAKVLGHRSAVRWGKGFGRTGGGGPAWVPLYNGMTRGEEPPPPPPSGHAMVYRPVGQRSVEVRVYGCLFVVVWH